MSLSRRQFFASFVNSSLILAMTTGKSEGGLSECLSEDRRTKFKVLSLDGGGARGYLTASLLANFEAHLNQLTGENIPLGLRFDLIAGTSTGGIIALGLAIGRTASDISDFYQLNLPKIFGDSQKRNKLRCFWGPKYDSSVLEKCLDGFFKGRTLKEISTDVCITSVALQNAQPRFYKSDYMARNKARLDERLVDIALSTSAAPTYFKAHSSHFSTNLIDGGICANNPAMVALVESFQFERPSKRGSKKAINIAEDVVMLSVGTGEQPAMPYDIQDLRDGGQLNWIEPISEVLMESQSHLVHHQMEFLLRHNYFRANPRLKFPMKLDDVSQIDELKNLCDITQPLEQFAKAHFI